MQARIFDLNADSVSGKHAPVTDADFTFLGVRTPKSATRGMNVPKTKNNAPDQKQKELNHAISRRK
jgi:hypothetical protein